MSLSSATLSTQLQAITGTDEATVITAWTAAWAAYFAGAVAGAGDDAVPFTVISGHITNARNAMAAAMVGISTADQGPSKVQAGIIAWWDTMVATPTAYFEDAVSISKPAGLTSIASNLEPILETNQLTSATSAAACDAISASLHSDNAGGAANYTGARTIA